MDEIREVAEIAARHSADVDQKARFPAEAIAALREAGLLAACAPVELGGAGLRPPDLAAIARQLARACAATAMTWSMHQGQLMSLCRFSTDVNYLTHLSAESAKKQWLIASVTSEPKSGGDLRSSDTALEPTGGDGGFYLVKRATAVSYVGQADLFLMTARRSPSAAPTDQVLVAVPAEQAALDEVGSWSPLGMRGTVSPACRITAAVSADQILPADFADIAAGVMVPLTQLLWSATWVGLAAEALDRAVRYTRRRVGSAGASAVKPALAEARWRVAAVDALVSDMAERLQRLLDDGGKPTVALAVHTNTLKLAASETALEAAMLALRVCGMAGYSEEGPFSIARIIRDLTSSVIMIGNDRLLDSTAQLMLMERPEFGSRRPSAVVAARQESQCP